MKKSMDPDVRERRKKLFALKFRGYSLSRIAERLADTYGITKKRVMRDWYTRKNWISEIYDFDLEDAETQLKGLIAEEEELKDELWKIHRDKTDPHVQMSAIKQIRNSNEQIVSLFKDLGIIEKDGGINISIQNTNASVEEKEASVADEIEKYREAIRNPSEERADQ